MRSRFSSARAKVSRADWTPPPWLVPDIALDIDLDPACTRVRARLEVRRNGAHALPLRLDGDGLKLLSARLDGKATACRLDPRGLTLRVPGDAATVETVVEIAPARNPAESGLFERAGLLATQCEPEGFRAITFFPDRPDVPSRFRVRLAADKALYPVLLSNGNCIARGDEDGRHWAEWHDPWPKPAYLFALLAGALGVRRTLHRTGANREIALGVWAKEADLPAAAHILDTLADVLAWDEQAFGRTYDLDALNAAIIPGFRFGAMENKGLLFFDETVLLDPDAATDREKEIAALLVAHEALHNWSGNRVTIRDWFELGWKEGLTVFRDQQFGAARGSAAAKRIDDVRILRAGPLARHGAADAPPVRPESYQEIGALFAPPAYTVAAEIVRMVETMRGTDPFRRAVAAFFDRYDGTAITWEDFLAAAAPDGLPAGFLRWCDSPGLPRLHIAIEHEDGRLVLAVTQRGDAPPKPIPLRVASFDRDSGAILDERLVLIESGSQRIALPAACAAPIVSLNRGFSAPISLSISRTDEDLAWLARYEQDGFARWDALQALMARAALGEADSALVAEALAEALARRDDPALLAMLAAPPHETELAAEMIPLDPQPIVSGLRRLRRELGLGLADAWRAIQRAPAADAGGRALRNLALDYLIAGGAPAAGALALAQLRDGSTMTEREGALRALADSDLPERTAALAEFHARWRGSGQALDKWFAAQALSRRAAAVEEARRLLAHPDFTIARPTRVGALLGGVASNFGALHHPAGLGYRLLADAIPVLDRASPDAALRIAAPLLRAPPLEPRRAALLAAELRRLRAMPGLSPRLAAQLGAIS